ncbi:MAG: phosphatidate cytidylyltransferase, partial [Deltaproteobacteria bacterium]|nr:phosphatidate cytidylyltransferase [Deltaproteobacteria bacterium]
VGIIAPVGDLFESMLKRKSDVKDSGTIMPGHGGLLDRIDAVLFAAPVVYYFKIYLM